MLIARERERVRESRIRVWSKSRTVTVKYLKYSSIDLS